jgi:isocitrate/isopropylmalate dehydrogenase
MSYHCVVLPGDGTGPEVMREGLRVLEAVSQPLGLSFDLEEIACGGQYFLANGKQRDWPEGSEERCEKADLILLGAVGWPDPDGSGGPVMMPNGEMAGWSPVIGNRIRLHLHANVRPVKLYKGVRQRIHGERRQIWEPGKVDLVIVRENTEDLYSGIGGILAPGGEQKVAVDSRVITREGSEKVIRTAFEICQRRSGAPRDGKKRVTALVKDNVMKGCQLFRDVFFEIGEEYPEIIKETALTDAWTQWLLGAPEGYDVCVTTNMFGDLVTDMASVLQGGMGMAAGANIGDEHGMFEPIHGSAPKYSGQDKVNPIAMILTVAEGLAWLGRRKSDPALSRAASCIEDAVQDVLEAGEPLTYDLVGNEKAAPCSAVGQAIASAAGQRARG